MLIGDLLQRRARISPQIPFWESAGGQYTYADANGAANRLAHALRKAGLAPGETLGIYADSGYTYAVLHFAAAKAGLVLAHLNPRYTHHELTWAARHGHCGAVCFGPGQQERVEVARSGLPGVRWWVAADQDAPPAWAVPIDSWGLPIGGAHSQSPVHPPPSEPEDEPPPLLGVTPASPFQLLFTSGTTGRPKGVLISHRSKLRLGQTHALNIGLRGEDRVLSSLPMHHHYAQWLLLVAVPLVGATVVHQQRFDPVATWEALADQRITHLPGVPTTLTRLLAHTPPTAATAPALRQVVYGGAPVAPQLIPQLRMAFPGVRLMQGFGQTETGACLVLHDQDHDAHPDSLGKPDLFSDLRLVDADGADVVPGHVGELIANTPYLMNGYLNQPEATAAYFQFGPGPLGKGKSTSGTSRTTVAGRTAGAGDTALEAWGCTGDLMWQDDAGYYYLAGRQQELIISGGVNIYPAEVERVLLGHPIIREAAVYGVPHADWGEAVTAAVILQDHAHGSGKPLNLPEQLGDYCREYLADFKCPRAFHPLPDFPRNVSGKVLKGQLPRPSHLP